MRGQDDGCAVGQDDAVATAYSPGVGDVVGVPAPGCLGVLPAGYRVLYQRVLATAAGDSRVRAMWLGGSLARGDADAGSDLDVLLAVRDDAFDEFTAGWREWVESVTPTVLSRTLPHAPSISYSMTPACERLDIVREPVGRLPHTPFRTRLLVLDKDGCDAHVPAAGPQPAPDPAVLRATVEEFLRQQVLFPSSVLGREDWLLGVEAVQGVRTLLYQLFTEANKPAPPRGLKHWSAKLTGPQREALADIRVPEAAGESVRAAMSVAASRFRAEARPVLELFGAAWPDDLDRSVTAYLDRQRLGLGLGEGKEESAPDGSFLDSIA